MYTKKTIKALRTIEEFAPKDEMLEMELLKCLDLWYTSGLGDEHLLDLILKRQPMLILNMEARVAELKADGKLY